MQRHERNVLCCRLWFQSFSDLNQATGPEPHLTQEALLLDREGHTEGVGGAPTRLPRPREAQTDASTSSVALGGAPQSQKRTPGGLLHGGARIVQGRRPSGYLWEDPEVFNAVEPC